MFLMEIKWHEEVYFTALGRHRRSAGMRYLEFIDAWGRCSVGTDMIQNPPGSDGEGFLHREIGYRITRGGRIVFYCHNGRRFYFAR